MNAKRNELAMSRLLRAMVPTGLRRLRTDRRLLREHGLLELGPSDPRRISTTSQFGRNCRVNGDVVVIGSTVGDFTYIEAGARLLRAHLGKFCAVAPKAQVGLAEHPLAPWVTGHPAFYEHNPRLGYDFIDNTRHDDLEPTTLGNDVWVGAAACVRSGVRVSDGAIIAAGAVVVKDVPPYAIVGGVPAKVIRYRFDDDAIHFLLELQWWHRSEEWLREHAHLMNDIDRLRSAIAEAKRG